MVLWQIPKVPDPHVAAGLIARTNIFAFGTYIRCVRKIWLTVKPAPVTARYIS